MRDSEISEFQQIELKNQQIKADLIILCDNHHSKIFIALSSFIKNSQSFLLTSFSKFNKSHPFP